MEIGVLPPPQYWLAKAEGGGHIKWDYLDYCKGSEVKCAMIRWR